eukprot:NODE_28981_length_460_cov_1.036036.p2 GENE.NODE_28981_length_460_cov_1.036036~~NODE_28981_length_460_cov_1.036036.p2  ORF type:complete len:71 (-),score=22.82 NODE_28981_length_460_cov_1.036036:47-259(-)
MLSRISRKLRSRDVVDTAALLLNSVPVLKRAPRRDEPKDHFGLLAYFMRRPFCSAAVGVRLLSAAGGFEL